MGATGLEPVTPSVSINPGPSFFDTESPCLAEGYANRVASSIAVKRRQSPSCILLRIKNFRILPFRNSEEFGRAKNRFCVLLNQ
jgi:hypothetical protein